MNNTYAQVAKHFAGMQGVETGRMFGAVGLKVAGKVFAMEVKGCLVVKLPAARAVALIAEKQAVAFDPGHGRLMKEWVAIAPSSKRDWLDLAKESYAYIKRGVA